MEPGNYSESHRFTYNEQFKVLICRECQYAIQKSAIESHLLRHKIYRGERRRLLSIYDQLDLVEPDDVATPDPASAPIEGFAVFDGYRCKGVACAFLAASTKRLLLHWAKAHPESGHTSRVESFARPVRLQTFFRGTKIRYFEVGRGRDVGELVERRVSEEGGEDVLDSAEAGIIGEQSILARGDTQATVSPRANVHLDDLSYYHQFIVSTSSTLPGGHWKNEGSQLAFQYPWLMSGLLALSAYHLGSLKDDESDQKVHRERARHYAKIFADGWDRLGSSIDCRNSSIAELLRQTGRQVDCLLHCARWSQEEETDFDLLSVMTTLRGCHESNLKLHRQELRDTESRNEAEPFAPAFKLLFESESLQATSDKIDRFLLLKLCELPFSIATVIGKAEKGGEVNATISAITLVVECCRRSFASNDIETTWNASAAWLAQVPTYFDTMVSNRHAAALIVLAFWAKLLVERAWISGSWFLEGIATKVLNEASRYVTGPAYSLLLDCERVS